MERRLADEAERFRVFHFVGGLGLFLKRVPVSPVSAKTKVIEKKTWLRRSNSSQ
jgi:hypothetical protein